ncbi:MAG: hypothetical protein LUC92_06030 [Clostridiales bacterium]|nr:hypothetical protein [Clostridiales bacterium]
MRDEYDIENLNPRKNPYTSKFKKQAETETDSGSAYSFKNKEKNKAVQMKG